MHKMSIEEIMGAYRNAFPSASLSELFNAYNQLITNTPNCCIQDLENILIQYSNIPVCFLDFLKAKFHCTKGNYSEAASYMDSCLSGINAADPFLIFLLTTSGYDKTIYANAGEIYAYNNMPEKSLRNYQDYEISVLRLSSCDFSNGLLSFRRFNEYSLGDLINNEITVCKPRVLNDPYDTLLLKWGESIRLRKGSEKFVGPECKSFDSYRIRSFCDLQDKEGNDILPNSLMWSHYADEHRGFCIKYRFSQDFLLSETRCTTRFKKIIYHDKNTPMNLNVDTMNTDVLLCTKVDDWSYESEIRLITYFPDVEGDYVKIKLDEKSYIDEIYFGYRCSSETIKTIKNVLKDQSGIKYFQMQSDFSNIYTLKTNPV